MNYNEITKIIANGNTSNYDLIDNALKRLDALSNIDFEHLIENQSTGVRLQIYDIQCILEAFLMRFENTSNIEEDTK